MEKLMIRTILTKFGLVRTALAVGVAIPFLAGSSAFAQDPSPAPALMQAVNPMQSVKPALRAATPGPAFPAPPPKPNALS